MPIAVVNQMKPHGGFVMLGPGSAQPEEVATTHINLDEEYWLALRHPAETQAAGFALLTQNHPGFSGFGDAEKHSLWKEFRAYVRQAEGFYRGAGVLPWKSSPLNYYYAFLNLAKAAALARGLMKPSEEQRVLQHGILAQVQVVAGNPDRWCLRVRRPHDAFGLLYAMSVGTLIGRGVELEVHTLLGYVSAIRWQMSKSGHGAFPATRAHWMLMLSPQAQQPQASWDMIAVDRRFPIERTPAAFQALYQELAPIAVRDFAWQALRMHGITASRHRFLERIVSVSPATEIEASIYRTAPYHLHPNLFGGDHQIVLSLPCTHANVPVPMTELVAAYAVMYFLSHLVRYHPEYMDRIGETSNAWLIESFAKSAPLHVLQYLTSAILGYSLKISVV